MRWSGCIVDDSGIGYDGAPVSHLHHRCFVNLPFSRSGRDLNDSNIETTIAHLKGLGIAEKAETANAHTYAKEIYDTLMGGFLVEVKAFPWADTQSDRYTENCSRTKDYGEDDKRTDGVPRGAQCGIENVHMEIPEGYGVVNGLSATKRAPTDTSLRAPPPSKQRFFPHTTYFHGPNTALQSYQHAGREYQPAAEDFPPAARDYQPTLESLDYTSAQRGANIHGKSQFPLSVGM